MPAKTAPQHTSRLAQYMAIVILSVLFLLPFHAFFTAWAASNIGYFDQVRLWKELIILILGIGSVVLLHRDNALWQQVKGSKLVMFIGLYVVFGLLRTGYGYSAGLMSTEAMAYGIIGAFRYLLFFMVVWIVATRSHLLLDWWRFTVLVPATLVIIYGLLQQFVLDKNFLTHFGYGPDTLPAFQSVDQKPEYIRAQSTLRGPNPLGAYLVLITTFLTAFFYRFKSQRLGLGILLILSSILLFFSYSRSAWIGVTLSLITWVLIVVRDKRVLKVVLFSGVLLTAALAMTIFALRNNDYVQNTLFHTDESSQSATSTNSVRSQALQNGLKDVWQHPLGQGLGTAGPASTRNETPKIAENYYIQVAQEVGIFGLFIYLAITLLAGYQLWQKRKELLPQVLFASLIGISAVNMISHAWMDDTLSLLWWGLAGIALAPVIIKDKHGKKQTKTAQEIA